jgi:hypothetical protein
MLSCYCIAVAIVCVPVAVALLLCLYAAACMLEVTGRGVHGEGLAPLCCWLDMVYARVRDQGHHARWRWMVARSVHA